MGNAARIRSRTPWRNRDFLGLAAASTVLGLGYQIYYLAFPLLANEISRRSPVAIGALQGIEFLPNLLLAMVIGVLVDRVSKRRFISAAASLRALVLFGVFALLASGVTSLGALLAAGFVLSAVVYAFHNARMAIEKLAFPRDQLTAVNGSLSALSQVVAIGGPALAGILLAALPLQDGVLIVACTALAGLFLLQTIRFSDAPPQRRGSFLRDLRDGWAELRRNHALWSLSLIVVFTNSTGGSFSAMFLFFAKDRLHVGNAELGLLLMVVSLGGAAGSALAATLRRSFGLARVFCASIALSALAYLLMFLARDMALTVLSLLLEGTASAVLAVSIWTFRQESTPPELIGRISGLTGSIFKLGMPFAIFASGMATAAIGARGVFLGCAAVNAALVIYFLQSPLRQVDRGIPGGAAAST